MVGILILRDQSSAPGLELAFDTENDGFKPDLRGIELKDVC